VKYWLYFQLNKFSCGFKEQAIVRESGEKCGLNISRAGIDLWFPDYYGII